MSPHSGRPRRPPGSEPQDPAAAPPARGAPGAGATPVPGASPRGRAGRTGGYARDRAVRARLWLRTTPARVWLLTAVCLVSVVGLFGSATFTLNQAREDLDVLGRGAGPQAMATTDLYLALADMDAQMADVLLMGTDHGLGSGRDEAIEQYEESRGRANRALLQAASLTEGVSVGERNVQAVLDGLGVYEQLAAEARLLNDEAQAPPGQADEAALESYREATQLMHTELLPKAFNLGLDSSAIVRVNHEEGQASVALGLVWVGAVGAVTVIALTGLQLYLRVRFRRRINAPLLAATAGTVALTVGVVLALVSSGGHQSDAKEEGLDTAMALSRAGAIATDMQADESRYLVDPALADNYQQVYLERAQQVLFRPADNLDAYYEAVDEVAASYPELPGSDGADPEDPGTLGYLGRAAQESLPPSQEAALADVLASYNAFQAEDRELRAAAREGDLDAALATRMEIVHAENGTFRTYEVALAELTGLHRDAFTEGIERGDSALAPWGWLLPAGVLALLALVALGVRPRLAEYR
ncbi:hypothetical protein ACFWTE_10740 [Nocardiopsis sp. NPDC058631]|uniref:hypothetical protein n=1 Tax=Nocardiopsis sp. NPDC058631 TaxID=3346566 RepID=UPI00364716FE